MAKWDKFWLALLLGLCLWLLSDSMRLPGQQAAKALPRTVPKSHSDYRAMAIAAVDDLLRHFWVGDSDTGHVLDTYNGYARKDDPRGILWERATFISVLENLYQVTKNPQLKQRLAADWRHLTSQITPSELQSCGAGSHNVGQDDAGWSALMYLNFYRATGDRQALEDARGLFLHAYDRWADDKLGGGLWYNDERRFKALYQAALILAGLRVYERTGDQTCRDHALALYDWVEKRLLRPDGLYWCEYWPSGPQAVGGIQEGQSVTFLGGNMAMGVIHAELYRLTKRALYRERALRTAEAILAHETDGKGHLLNDRDAYADGYFMGAWAREVLTLPGIQAAHRELIWSTADAIWQQARTPQGYFSGCWNGPAKGEACPWNKAGFKPEQIMTSSSTVNVLIAASQLDISATR